MESTSCSPPPGSAIGKNSPSFDVENAKNLQKKGRNLNLIYVRAEETDLKKKMELIELLISEERSVEAK